MHMVHRLHNSVDSQLHWQIKHRRESISSTLDLRIPDSRDSQDSAGSRGAGETPDRIGRVGVCVDGLLGVIRGSGKPIRQPYESAGSEVQLARTGEHRNATHLV